MTHRGRYSYASSTAPVNVNSPRRVRRRKDPTPFNILVIGAKNSGKTSFISFLRHSLARPTHTRPYTTDPAGDAHVPAARSSFTSHYLESEMDGERIGVTLWDSAGLEKHVIDLQLREMATFVEAKFEETFVEEQKVVRSPGFRDTHIHCAFLVLDPVRLDATTAASKTAAGLPQGGLDDELDLQVLRSLWGKTTVIPVIAKADTLTTGHMSFLKRAVWESLKSAKLDPLEALELEGEDEPDSDTLPEGDEGGDEQHPRGVNHIAGSRDDSDDDDDDDDDDSSSASDAPVPRSKRSNGHHRQPSLAGTVASVTGEELPYLPMSTLSPDLYDLPPYTTTAKDARVGRSFPWGFADPYDPEHCDFTRLRDSIFSEWRGDLRDLSRTKWYENWRTSRLKNLPGSKQRVRGGVTPVAVVPREGRTVSPTTN
ncbi:Septin GTPase family [Teratosphaeria destructans]|uniref:Septin GTPase family n=1 Tax=Teratosphaeria destructans TaxID=418781 RepID=A0A9W7SZL4_9PEZI|nr:Septin GTPase family [Teratosphaeria destructans]